MLVFVYEYASAQPPTSRLPASIRAEGRAMLEAALADFSRISGLVAASLPVNADGEESAFKQIARQANWSFIIAPELNRLLEERCRWVEEVGGQLLGPSAKAVRELADKWRLCQLLRGQGVPTPDAWIEKTPPLCSKTGYVCKPRWGAGSTGVRKVEAWPEEIPPGHFVQAYVAGKAVSIATLIGPHGACWLLPAEQRLTDDGCFTYVGGCLPLPERLAARTETLARQALAALQTGVPLRGYVGFDVVLGDDPCGRGDYVIEVNFRLTTSYVGLRTLARQNLMEVLLRLQSQPLVEPLAWDRGSVVFDPQGRVRYV